MFSLAQIAYSASHTVTQSGIGLGRSITEILGSPDDLKLRSCATLFASLSPSGSVFERILKKYYGGVGDERTLGILEKLKEKTAD